MQFLILIVIAILMTDVLFSAINAFIYLKMNDRLTLRNFYSEFLNNFIDFFRD